MCKPSLAQTSSSRLKRAQGSPKGSDMTATNHHPNRASLWFKALPVTLCGFVVLLAQSGLPTAVAQGPESTGVRECEGSTTTPLTVTEGGTYVVNIRALDVAVPAITVATEEPVVVSGCIISRGQMVRVLGQNAHVTLDRLYGRWEPIGNPVENQGRFLFADQPAFITITNSSLVATEGIRINGYLDPSQPGPEIVVRNNFAYDVRQVARQSPYANFLQLVGVHGGDITIHGNTIENRPEFSMVEDNINIYESSGTPGNPMEISYNRITGAFPFPSTSATYSGGGIVLDGPDVELTAHVDIHHNEVRNTTNYGIGLAAADEDVAIEDNCVIQTLAEARPAANVGIVIWDWPGDGLDPDWGQQPGELPFVLANNTIGWSGADGVRNDTYIPGSNPEALPVQEANNTYPPDPLTPEACRISGPLAGGSSGTHSQDQAAEGETLIGITFAAGAWLDSFQVVTTGGRLPIRGGPFGDSAEIDLIPGDAITGVSLYHDGSLVRSIEFMTAAGQRFGPLGIPNGERVEFEAPPGHALVGFEANSGQYINGLRPIFGAQSIPPWSVSTRQAGTGTGGLASSVVDEPLTSVRIRQEAGAVLGLQARGNNLAGEVIGSNTAGQVSNISLSADDPVAAALVTVQGDVLSSVQFRGESGLIYGAECQDCSRPEVVVLEVPSGHRMVGLYGRAGNAVETLGLLTAPE